MSKTTSLENVILFARAGFRGINDAAQVEEMMNAVVGAIDGTELMVDGAAVGTISEARVEGSLIRGNVSDVDTAFLQSEAGLNLCRRIAASFEAPAQPAKKAVAKPAAKPVKKAVKTAEPESEDPAEEPEAEEPKAPAKKAAPTKKAAPVAPAKPAAKGKPVVPMNKKIKVNL